MGHVTYRRFLVLAVLIYVTLDLSLPAMPGAFVFAPADSAEGTGVRARAATEIVAGLTQTRDAGFVLFQPPLQLEERLAPVSSAESHARPGVSWRSPAHNDPATPPEDPH